MARVLEDIARECGLGVERRSENGKLEGEAIGGSCPSTDGGGMAVAIAYVMQKTTYVFPILGTSLSVSLRLLSPSRKCLCASC